MGSDCLSDPQKNSSITCGFPFLFFFKYLSFYGTVSFCLPALYSRVQTVFQIFDPFLLYLTFSILKQKLSARVGTAIESEKTKCLDVFTLGIAQSDCLFFHS